jgi:hypothetical protein
MSSTSHIATQEISDADLDNVSGGVAAGGAGALQLETPVASLDAAGAAGVHAPLPSL